MRRSRNATLALRALLFLLLLALGRFEATAGPPPPGPGPQPTPSTWTRGTTSVSGLSVPEKAARLGVPPWVEEWEREQAAQASPHAGALYTYPSSLDWRNVDGADWTTPIRDQGGCGSCVAFGTTGAIEARYKIARNDPDLEPDLSEAHLYYCSGRQCSYDWGWWPEAAMDMASGQGVADEACFPYYAGDQPCGLCADWQSRVTTILDWAGSSSTDEMKQALADGGPIEATFSVYDDFYGYTGGVYHYDGESTYSGGHAVTLVGYDDAEQYWIARNSWGTGWGEGGWFKIGYGECGIDSYAYIPLSPARVLVEGVTSPAAAYPDSPLRVSWCIVGRGTVAHTNLHWGTAPESYPNYSDEYTGAMGCYTGTLTAPASGTVYFVAHAVVGGLDYYSEEHAVPLGTCYRLTVTVGSGVGTVQRWSAPNCGARYGAGTAVGLSPQPGVGYCFAHWSGDALGSAQPLTVTLTADTSVVAHFVASYPLTITTPMGHGEILASPSPSCEGGYAAGSQVLLTAQPEEGYVLDHWAGDAAGTSITTTVLMDSGRAVEAYFLPWCPPGDAGGDAASAVAIALPAEETEYLCPGDDVDRYRFHVPFARVIHVSLASAPARCLLRLFSPDGSLAVESTAADLAFPGYIVGEWQLALLGGGVHSADVPYSLTVWVTEGEASYVHLPLVAAEP